MKGVNELNNLPDTVEFYIITGEVMNREYDLAGDNVYPDDLHIVCFPLEYATGTGNTVYVKQRFKVRYFNDIVDNNEYREYIAGRHEKSPQIQWIIDAYNKK